MRNVLFFGFIFTVVLSNCALPYADKQFLNFDSSSKAERVKYEIMGENFLFLKIKSGDSPSIRTAINVLAKINSCKDLKNIDIEFFENYYFLVGFPKIIILADCVKTVEEKKQ
ncbi:MAG: hypothetical protein L6Q54_13925 [Leptospiraceae bacterium]|nr:hypothetical protein [Leptospiraceae bacterium]MCK6382333.1 hypothetical protein [Leptospiraceae bacterium]NUM40891.1 hypothetical protein [Leptospiraceae bacterium]